MAIDLNFRQSSEKSSDNSFSYFFIIVGDGQVTLIEGEGSERFVGLLMKVAWFFNRNLIQLRGRH
jgi:hypothetical protein